MEQHTFDPAFERLLADADDDPRANADAAIVADALARQGFDAFKVGVGRGLDARQVRFALGLHAGLEQWRAYAAAGFKPDVENPGKDNSFRSAASKAAKTKKIADFIDLLNKARTEKSKPLAPMTKAERLALLDNVARGHETATTQQMRAVMAGIELDERIAATAPDHDPVATLTEIAALSPLCAQLADELARVNNINFSSAKALASPSAPAIKTQAVTALIDAPARPGAEAAADARG